VARVVAKSQASAHSARWPQGSRGRRCQVASGQIQLLSVLSDYLSYIVLAPFVGSEHAARVVIEDA